MVTRSVWVDWRREVWLFLKGDRWLVSAFLSTALIYAMLLFIQPSGENWGRGWNLLAFYAYAAPWSMVVAWIAFWRQGKVDEGRKRVARVVGVAAVVFPLVALVALKMKL